MARLLGKFAAAGIIASAIMLTAGCGNSGADENAYGTGDNIIILDVRSSEEFDSGHLEGAINLSIESQSWDQEVSSLNPDATYLVYSDHGRRSTVATKTLKERGFGNVENLFGIDHAEEETGLGVVNE